MYISLNWLKEFVDIPKNLDPKDLGDLLTLKTAEVEEISGGGRGLDGVVVGEILEISKHPNADKLNLAKVDVGKGKPINLIFGQMVKMKIGNKVPVAVAPTTLPTGVKIEKREMRGQMSEGMLCLDQEMGLKKDGVSIQYFPHLKPGTPIVEALNLTDISLEFDNKSLTHRPDLWGHYGIAREVAAITGGKFKPLKPTVKIPSKGESIKVEIKDQILCPRYCGLIIKNIKVGPSPDWLVSRLRTIGHGSHNNIVDVTNYVMAELGQPLHAFDQNYIKGGIIVRTAKDKELITTLDDKKRTLDKSMLVIADHEKPVAIAGIMGGENSGINEKTTAIILESATFDAGSIRRTSTALGLRTDAVQRFEKALDPLLAELAITRAAELILKICPGAVIAGPITDIKKFNTTPLKITLDTDKARSKIGVDISNKDIKDILEKLEFIVQEKTKNKFEVTVPSFRATKDVGIEDDLIEEIARLYGYDKISPELPTLPTKLPMENTERFQKHRVRELFSYGLGFDEVYNYSFYGLSELKNCLMSEAGHLKLLNYLSEDQTHMRRSLVPNILKNLQLNIKNFDELKIYEIGHTYKEIGTFHPLEEKIITGAILSSKKSADPFYEAKGATETILEKFGINKFSTANKVEATPYAHPSKSMSFIDQNGQTIARTFALHPTVSKNHDLSNYQVSILEINFTELARLDKTEKKYQPIPRFPSIEIDVSVLIDKSIEVEKIAKTIQSSDNDLITNVELFDIYHGENIANDKKAVAYKITLQSADRTLTDREMTETQKKIFTNLEKIGGKVRGA